MTNLTRLGKGPINGIAFDLNPLARELKAYGESEVAKWLLNVDDITHDKISEKAMKYLLSEDTFIDKAICLAAIEVKENVKRPLRRKRRNYKGIP